MKIAQTLWGIVILTLPFTVSTVLWQENISGQSNFNAYTSFSLYGSEILLFLALAAWIVSACLKKKHPTIDRKILITAGVTLALTGLPTIWSESPLIALWGSVHVLAALIALFFTTQKLIEPKKLIQLLTATLTLQALIGIAQVITQGSLGLSILGESLIGPDVAGVAKIDLGFATMVRAYGTFPHANILAGFLLVGLFLSQELKGTLWKIARIVMGIAFLLAFSKGAILAFVVIHFFQKITKKQTLATIVLGVCVLAVITWESSVSERLETLKISLSMIGHEPLGVGLDQFTARMQEFGTDKLQPWQYQPVHNIFLLLWNELGIWTLYLFLEGGRKLLNAAKTQYRPLLWGILTIGFFDHYLISFYQGLLLFAIAVGYVWSQSKWAPTKCV